MSYRSILQVFSVSIQLKDEIISEHPLNVTIGDTTSPPSTVFTLPAQLPCEQTVNKSVKLYGSIKIIDAGTYETVLYNRDKHNPQLISFGDTISLLGGPKRCPNCLGFTMHINLHEADQDLEISRGYLYFEYYISDYRTYYDHRFSAVIHGQHGSATVFYTLFKQALQAKLGAAALVTNNISTTDLRISSAFGSDIATLCAEAEFLIPHQMGMASHSQSLQGDNLNLQLEVTWSRGA